MMHMSTTLKQRAMLVRVGDKVVGWYPERQLERIEGTVVSSTRLPASNGTTVQEIVLSDGSELTVRPSIVFLLEI